MPESKKVTINDKEYDFDTLTEKARNDFIAIKTVDRKIADTQQELAILQTARNAYANSLNNELPKDEK